MKEWAYTHPPITQQLDMGWRTMELDFHLRAKAPMFYHIQMWDQLLVIQFNSAFLRFKKLNFCERMVFMTANSLTHSGSINILKLFFSKKKYKGILPSYRV